MATKKKAQPKVRAQPETYNPDRPFARPPTYPIFRPYACIWHHWVDSAVATRFLNDKWEEGWEYVDGLPNLSVKAGFTVRLLFIARCR